MLFPGSSKKQLRELIYYYGLSVTPSLIPEGSKKSLGCLPAT